MKHARECTPRYIIFKLQKIRGKENILKEVSGSDGGCETLDIEK